MGCIYTGYRNNQRVNGYFKIGMTKDEKPTRRFNACDIIGIYWLDAPKATTAELLLLESVARVAVERTKKVKLSGTDYFWYPIEEDKKTIAKELAEIAMLAVEEACDVLGIEDYQVYKIPFI